MRTRINVTFKGNFPDYRSILIGGITAGLTGLGKILQTGVRSRVKVWRGDEKRAIKYEVTGRGVEKELFVYGDLVQHFIDELGLKPGTFPPWAPSSLLYQWAKSKYSSWDFRKRAHTRSVSHVYTRRPGARASRRRASKRTAAKSGRGVGKRIAAQRTPASARVIKRERAIRAIAFLVARKIFEEGIKAGQPFSKTLIANRNRARLEVSNAIKRAINKMNG